MMADSKGGASVLMSLSFFLTYIRKRRRRQRPTGLSQTKKKQTAVGADKSHVKRNFRFKGGYGYMIIAVIFLDSYVANKFQLLH